MKRTLVLTAALLSLLVFLTQCGVNRQLTEAKTFGNCRYRLVSADSVALSGYDIRQFRSVSDLNPLKFPRLAAALLTRNVPLDLRVNLGIINPTNRLAGINQLEYRILLKTNEIFQGYLNQRIEVPVGGQEVIVPVRLRANAYALLTDAQTRDAFAELVQNLSGNQNTKPTRLTIKIKPTLALGGKAINYPGYITIDQDVTNKILLGQ
jgi:hypothetical protein